MSAFFSQNAGDRCATCQFWSGERQLRAMGTEVEVPSPETKGNCSVVKAEKEAEDNCPGYKPWASLKVEG